MHRHQQLNRHPLIIWTKKLLKQSNSNSATEPQKHKTNHLIHTIQIQGPSHKTRPRFPTQHRPLHAHFTEKKTSNNAHDTRALTFGAVLTGRAARGTFLYPQYDPAAPDHPILGGWSGAALSDDLSFHSDGFIRASERAGSGRMLQEAGWYKRQPVRLYT